MLGIGLGGFLDGIVLHQIAQVHAMLSAKVPLHTMENMRTNMTADGYFHAGTWIATLIGVVLLWKALNRPSGRPASAQAFAGYMLAGWGWFNLIEGLIDHHILRLHHVVERLGLSIWDWAFLASGVALILIGHMIARSALRT
jgi:uncharacterized membrane protein